MDSEKELVLRAREGCQDSFAELVAAHQNRIFSLTFRMTGNPEDASDLAQEAFLNAWRFLPGFQGESSFSTWLYRLASNACIDFLRREKKRRSAMPVISLDDSGRGRPLDVPDHRFSPEREIDRIETSEAIARAILSLSHEHRAVLVLREVSGLSYSEIKEVLGVEEGTVKSRLSRARREMRKYLQETGNILPQPPSKKT